LKRILQGYLKTLYEKTIASVPETVEGTAVEYLNGVVKVDSRLIVLLNLPKVLSLEDHLQ